MSIRSLLSASLVLALACPLSASLQANTNSNQAFVTEASQAGATEVAIGKLAQAQATSADAKHMAAMIVKDHTQANETLAGIAKAKSLHVADAPGVEGKKSIADLQALQGDQFDRAFASIMVIDHQKAVAAFERASKTVTDPQLRGFAVETLPTLKSHLKMAQALEGKDGAASHPHAEMPPDRSDK